MVMMVSGREYVKAAAGGRPVPNDDISPQDSLLQGLRVVACAHRRTVARVRNKYRRPTIPVRAPPPKVAREAYLQ